MVDSRDRFAEVERMIKSAARDVQPSADLRRRTLEAAQIARAERRGQQWVRHVAIAAAVVGLAISLRGTTETTRERLDAEAIDRPAALRSVGPAGLGRELVKSLADPQNDSAE
jgi:hypothetical protein